MLFKTTMLLVLLSAMEELKAGEQYGKTLNFGLGSSWYGHYRVPVNMLHLNYEFDVAKQVTIAPFISYYIHNYGGYYAHPRFSYRTYRYYETLIPIGVKGNFYLDDAIHLNKQWDMYLGASLGAGIIRTSRTVVYDNDKYVYRNVYGGTTPLFLDIHLGGRYHINERVGVFLDLSTAISSIGLSFKTN